MNIGDLFLALRGDGTMLQQDVVKAGDKAGQTFSQRFGSQVKTGLRSALGAGVGFAVGQALVGANELDAATRRLQADTGMTADEADRAQHAIAGLYQNNIQGFDQIGDAMSKVITDMGLTGDAATETTDAFLKFATATGQDATEAVTSLDDILDSWGLTAEDTQTILDELVVSHQKWGGSIADNEKTLSALAPAMKAANMNIDDGIALLNLFGSKGLTADVAATGFAKALTKVKSPEELQGLIDDISATEDPLMRAQKAAALFGNRAGPRLANALAGVHLDDFKVGMDEAAGATEEAAAAVESSWGHRFTLLMHQAGGALADFGTKFGPLLMVASAFGPQFTKLLTTSLGGLAGYLAPVLKTVGAKIGIMLAGGVASEMAVGKTVGTAIESMPTGPVGKVAVFAGTKLGALMGGAMMGGIIAAGAAALYVVEQQQVAASEKILSDQFGKALTDMSVEQMRDLRTKLAQEMQTPLAQIGQGAVGLFGGKGLQTQLDQLDAAIASRSASGAGAVGGAVDQIVGDLKDDRIGNAADAAGQDIEDGLGDGAANAAATVETAAGKILASILGLRGDVGSAASAAANAIFDPFLKGQEAAQTKRDIAEQQRIIKDRDSTKKQVREAKVRRAELQKQLFVQLTDLTTYGTDAQRIAAIQAALSSKAVADAYANGTPEQRAAIDEWRRVLGVELTTIQQNGATGGAKTGTAYAQGLAGKQAAVTKGATTAVSGVDNTLKMEMEAHNWGASTAQAYADGIKSKVIATRNAAIAVSKAAQTIWRATSPPGPASPLHEIDTWGANTVSAWLDGMLGEQKNVTRAAQTVSGAAAAPLSSPFAAGGMAARATPAVPGLTGAASVANKGDVYNIHVPVQGLIRARDPLEVAGQLRRLADLGALSPKKPAYR